MLEAPLLGSRTPFRHLQQPASFSQAAALCPLCRRHLIKRNVQRQPLLVAASAATAEPTEVVQHMETGRLTEKMQELKRQGRFVRRLIWCWDGGMP